MKYFALIFAIIIAIIMLITSCKPCKEIATTTTHDSISYIERIVYQQLPADSGLIEALVNCQNSLAFMPDTNYYIGKYSVTSKIDSGVFKTTWKRGIDSSLYYRIYNSKYKELVKNTVVVQEKKVYVARWLYWYAPISMVVIVLLLIFFVKKLIF